LSIFHLKHEIYTRMAYHMPWLPPHRFVFVLTNQCNLSCEKCFQDRKYKKTILSKEQWIKLSDAIPGFSRITITGGEPLLFPGFGEIFGAIADRHECNLITNGTLLTEDLIDLLVSSAKFKVLAISIDDLKTGGTDIRRLSERQWDNLERMAGYFVRRRAQEGSDCSLEIKTLIIDGNAGRLFDIHRY